jgi:transmembrane sensor
MRFAAGRADRTELEAFRQWSARDPAHMEAFARACRVWDGLGPAGQALILPSGAKDTGLPRKLSRRFLIGGTLAASAAVVYVGVRPPLGLWPSLSELAADYRTGTGEQRQIVLNGGPSVEMNTRTSMALRTAPNGGARLELINGEAAISVGSDVQGSFEVIAGSGRVIASVAVFNLRYEADTVCTTCVAGAVDVEHGMQSSRLQVGEQIVYSRKQLGRVTLVDTAVVTAWKDGVLVFHATPLSEAVSEINRYRPGRIILTNAALGQRLFNARFRIENIGGVVAQIQQVFGASATALPGGIVLLG